MCTLAPTQQCAADSFLKGKDLVVDGDDVIVTPAIGGKKGKQQDRKTNTHRIA